MSVFGSQKDLNMAHTMDFKHDLTGGGSQFYARSELVQGAGNGFDSYLDGYTYAATSRSAAGGAGGTLSAAGLGAVHQRARMLQAQCQDYLKKAEFALQAGGAGGEAEGFMALAWDTIEQLKALALDLRQQGRPADNVVRTLELCRDQLNGVHQAIAGTLHRRRSTRGSGGAAWEDPGRTFQDAMSWIAQQKRLIQTAFWGKDPAAIEQQLVSHQRFHSSIQRSAEVDRAREELMKKGERGNVHALDQEWDSLQKMSFGRTQQLQELQQIVQEMSKEIMWVNDREEEELVFDWGDKNIEQYIPRKQESYSKLMSDLEVKEKDLNKLKAKADALLKSNHPASDKIEAYRDTLQTQWSWLLQITKCIDVHLKENAAYNQFFLEADDTYSKLQKEHETVRRTFTCNKNTSLEDLVELLRRLERERERITQNKRQVQHLVANSKNIVRLKPRNPDEKSGSPVIVRALCDFVQDQKVICKGNEAILKNNSQRSKWEVTGPGGLDMTVPSVCLIIPPPNPLSVSLANKNEQYYEAILSLWNQLYIDVKSLIAWQYCILDVKRINSLTISVLAKMRPEEYRQILKSLETHFEEFKVSSQGSLMFADEDKKSMEQEVNGAQTYYNQLVVQLPVYTARQGQWEVQVTTEEEATRLEEERRRAEAKKPAPKKESTVKKEVVKVVKTEPPKKKVVASSSLSDLHALRLRLEGAEGALSQHVHICLGDDGVHDCGLRISQLESVLLDIDSMCEEYRRLRERIVKELESMSDPDKAQFLHSELTIINQRLAGLEGSSSAYLQRLRALRDLLESLARADDIVKVHETILTEKETTSLTPSEVEDYVLTLKNIKAQLDQKKDVLASMENELAKVSHWNSQVGGSWPKCDMVLSKYTEQVGLLGDRWRRINGQIDTRLQDLQSYQPQLQRYKESSVSFDGWIEATRKKQQTLQATKMDNVQTLTDHINQQKALNSEIKSKREILDGVLRDNTACGNSIRDYESVLAAYTSGLETLLNIPIKRTMLKSPTVDLNQEATQLQTRYMELLTMSADYYRFLGDLLKNMEELKIRNTKIDLLEEELHLLKENTEDSSAKNKALDDDLGRHKLELSQLRSNLLSVEEVKESTVLQCNAFKQTLDGAQSKLSELSGEVTRLNYLLEEEKRARRLAEERYSHQQEEYESVLRRRQKELETLSWSKMELEKSLANKEHEVELLRRQLDETAEKTKELQAAMSKVRSQCLLEIRKLKISYESQIQAGRADVETLAAQREEATAEFQTQQDRLAAERANLEEELSRLQGLNSELEEQKKSADEEVRHQRGAIAEEERRRGELEAQVEALMRQRDEGRRRHRDELDEIARSLKEKSDQVAYVTHNLEEETRRRRSEEERLGLLEKSLAELQTKLASSSAAAAQLQECKAELERMSLDLERESKEKIWVKQNLRRTQGRMKDLQAVRGSLENQVEKLRTDNQEEVCRRRQMEGELEKSKLAISDYENRIAKLQQDRDRAGVSEKRTGGEHLKLKEELERSLEQKKTAEARVTRLSAEMRELQQQQFQEQARLQEANLRNEDLQRAVEQKSKAVMETTCELQRLQQLSASQAKERLRLEEELGAARKNAQSLARTPGEEASSRIASLELQLQAGERSSMDLRSLVSELSSEREALQTQATETSLSLHSLQSQHAEVVAERDALLLKLQSTGKDKDRLQTLEQELIQIRLTLESELCNKQMLMEENQRLKAEEGYWKNQCDSSQGLIRQYAADKDRLEMERNSLRSDIEKLKRELRELEEMYKTQMTSTQKELREVIIVRKNMETELQKAREPPTVDASTLVFDGVRKSVTANQLAECGVLDKPTLNMLVSGHKTVPDVALEKKIYLKGSGPIAGVIIEGQNSPGSLSEPCYKMTFTEAKKEKLLPADSVDLLLDAQAATGHIIDPKANRKLTVEEACLQGVVDQEDKERLLAAEAAAVGYLCPGISKPLSIFQAMKKGLIDRTTTLRVLQAQESVGGILDPVLSVFLPKQTATDRYLLDEDTGDALSQQPELYLDPESEVGVTYMAMKRRCKVEPHTGLLLLPIVKKIDPSKLTFDGVRKPVTAKQLADCGVLDKLTLRDLEKGKRTVPEVSVEKSVNLKGTGPIAGVIVGSQGKMSLAEAKKLNLLSEESADLLLDAQAATGHIIDPRHGQKLTVEEACARGVVDFRDRGRLLEAEAAAVGYRDPGAAKPLAVFEAMRKGLVGRKAGLRLLQAQESAGGILDPDLSVFLPRDKAIERNIIDEEICRALNARPEYYLDPDSELNTSYGALKEKCKTESHTSLLFLPIAERKDPSKLMFMGIRKPVSAKELLECGVLDKPTFNQLVKGEKIVPTVSEEKRVHLKGTGPIAGVVVGRRGKMALSEAKKQNLLPKASADLLLDAQAAIGHIIDLNTNQKLTVEEACARGVVDVADKDRLLAAEAAAVGYKHQGSATPLSVFEAFKKGLVDRRTGLRLLQAQESAGGILDPNRSVFLSKENAIRHNLLDEDLSHALKQSPAFYVDPETELNVSYGALKERCMTEPHTGLQLLPISEKTDPSKLLFDGVRKDVTAQQLLDCGVLDKRTFDQLIKGEKTVPEVAIDKKLFLKGTGSIAGVAAGPFGKMSFTEAKQQKMMSPESADLLLEAQAATGRLIDPRTNRKLTVKEACADGVIDPEDEPKLLVAEAAAMGYLDPNTGTILSAGQAVNKGLLNKDTALRLLQAQQSVGGILDPILSVFLSKDIAINRGIIDTGLYEALNRSPQCYLDPDSQQAATYLSLKTKCKMDPSSDLLLLPEPEKPLTVEGLRGPVSVIDLVDANLLERHAIDQVREGRLTRQEIENVLYSYLRGSTCIAGVYDEVSARAVPVYQAMKEGLLQPYSALELLEAQAASGFIVDPVNNLYLTVTDAYNRNLFGPEFKVNLQAAEKAVTGYKLPGTDKTLSLFQAIERGSVDKGRGMRLLEAQMASGGIIDPEHGHRVNMDVAYRRGYLNQKMSNVLSVQSVDYKGYLDPNTDENLTYAELKKRCITDKKTGLFLLPILDESKKESTTKNTLRKRRVLIVDPETNREMTIREAYEKGYIDHETFLELSKQECEWEEITIVDPDGSTRFVIIDRKTERKYDITELLKKRLISQSDLDRYRSQSITLNEFADIITNKTKAASGAASVKSSVTSVTSLSSSTTPVQFSSSTKTLETSGPLIIKSTATSVRSRPSSPTLTTNSTVESSVTKRTTTITSVSQDSTDHHRTVSKVSISLSTPFEAVVEQEPVGAIFDTENLQKISVTDALNCGLVDSVTAQRLLEAQACTGGIINPVNGQRLGLQEASRLGIITEDMGSRLKPAQKAFFGFEDMKHKKKMSAAEAMKEMWLPYEAGHRFMEFQYVTGGLYDPEVKCRRSIQDALEMGWLDERTAHKLQDVAHHTKNLTCPKSKLKISYKEALNNCMVEQKTGVKMLQASSVSSRGISSPYNVASAPGSTTGSRSGSRRSSRRSSVDFGCFSSFLSPA